MRDVKVGGDKNWPHAGIERIPGDPDAKPNDYANWNVAVLRVEPAGVPFTVLFINGGNGQYLRPGRTRDLTRPPWQRHAIRADHGSFGMRVGPEDVILAAFDTSLKRSLSLKLIEVVPSGDGRYPDLLVN